MQKSWKIILIASICLNLALIFILTSEHKVSEPIPDIYVYRIDSLEAEISLLQHIRDSIEGVTDTIYLKIKDNQENYEELRDSIIHNSSNDDYLFFTEYLKYNRERHNHTDNSSTVKRN